MKKRKVLAILKKYASKLSLNRINPSLLKIYSDENDTEDKCFSISRLRLEKSTKKIDDYASIVAEFYLGNTEPIITFRSRKKMSKIITSQNLSVQDAIYFEKFLHPFHNEDNEKILFEFMERIEMILDCELSRMNSKK